uniref:F-box protein 40 n=1 Tax=Haplochromis burtoni TaxID=8153 RepID=A0A3Q2WF58_HAPBU
MQQHIHCDSCYSRRCRARVEASVCCAVTPCRLHCGALFHLCKEEDHLLLCPNVRVPCINAAYGCPVQLPRSSRASHLQVCPASVVCCTMEWLRWPTDDTNPHSHKALQDNLVKESEGQEEALDLAMAIIDQKDLYSRLKMKPLYPELTEEEEEEINDEMKEEAAAGGVVNGVHSGAEQTVPNSAVQGSGINKDKYDLFEMMFSMDRGGCEAAQENLNNPKQNPNVGDKGKTQSGRNPKGTERQDQTDAENDSSAAKNCPPADTSKTGMAPWQEGVLDRLGQELTPHEYNMYVVHHGRMLLAFGQIEACTPREKDFVYGSLEPIPVQTLRSFKVMKLHLFFLFVFTPNAIDASENAPNAPNLTRAHSHLNTCPRKIHRASKLHILTESKAYDGLYIDVGTQTYSFRSAPFKGKTTLAEVMVDRPLKLHLQLQAESVNSRHNRASCVFTFLCGHTFHRREFATHVRHNLQKTKKMNVHCDIHTCLSGWFEQRCPLAYLGCTYSQRRFHPSTHKATVTYNKELRSFNLRPTFEGLVGDNSPTSSEGRGGSLSSLPYEVLCHMASFLDSLSLFQLALVSRLMRQVCSTLLKERGMVTFRWEKKTYSHGRTKWRVWEFSHLFSSVDSWHMADIPPISAHLKVCPYYEVSLHSKPVSLPSMDEKCSQKSSSLVNHFTGNR